MIKIEGTTFFFFQTLFITSLELKNLQYFQQSKKTFLIAKKIKFNFQNWDFLKDPYKSNRQRCGLNG